MTQPDILLLPLLLLPLLLLPLLLLPLLLPLLLLLPTTTVAAPAATDFMLSRSDRTSEPTPLG